MNPAAHQVEAVTHDQATSVGNTQVSFSDRKAANNPISSAIETLPRSFAPCVTDEHLRNKSSTGIEINFTGNIQPRKRL